MTLPSIKDIKLENGLKANLNFETLQASISFTNSCSFSDLKFTIPSSISYENKDFLVTEIKKSSKDIFILSDLNFDDNCKIEIVNPQAFQSFLSISNLTIPNSVTNLEGFCGNVHINNISFSPKNPHFSVLYNGLIVKNNIQGSVENSEIIFSPRNIQTIAIPPIIKKIGDYSFQNCKHLTTIIFITNSDGSSQLEEIGNYAFSNCTNLQSICLPSTIKTIGSRAFDNCSQLTSFIFSEGIHITQIPSYAFSHCSKLIQFTIPPTVRQIHQKAFYNCYKLIKVVFQPDEKGNSSIEKINENAFSFCPKLLAITIPQPNHVYSILKNGIIICNKSIVFVPRHLNQVSIDSDIKFISKYAFQYCKQLKSIDFTASKIEEIDDYAFMNCISLISIELPSTVKKIGKCAFLKCKKLQSVILSNTLTEIGCSAFRECCSLSSISIPSSVTKIGKNAFQYCEELSSVTFINCQLNELDDYTFANCSRLVKILIPACIHHLGKFVFYKCDELNLVEMLKDENGKSNLDFIDKTCFLGCKKLPSIESI